MDDESSTTENNLNLSKKKKKQAAASNKSTSTGTFVPRRVFIRSKRRLVDNRDVDAIALALGMSMASVFAEVMKKKDEVGEQISVEYLATISTLAISESLANVFGNRFDGFVQSFEKSFRSTLRTLTLINETCTDKEKGCSSHINDESCNSGVNPPNIKVDSARFAVENLQEVQEYIEPCSAYEEGDQQLACITTTTTTTDRSLGPANHSMLTTFERSVTEQARSNDLKSFEISLQLKSLRLKERKLALDSESNLLDRLKLSMGISKASFQAEKFKNQVESTKHAELLKKCIDCLVAGLFIMSLSLGYGAYVHSYERILEATQICTPTTGWKTRWIPDPITLLNSGLKLLGFQNQVLSRMLFRVLMILVFGYLLLKQPITFILLIIGVAYGFAGCQVQVLSRMLFGVLMILAIAYLLLQRSSTLREGMPITFILLILGVACGFAGKVCVDSLGGNGYHWLLYWEALCLLHFFSNVCTSLLFVILYGPVIEKDKPVFPYWTRRILFFTFVLLILPMLCGLMPFATQNEWMDHFFALLTNFLG